jgi:hypothetical protein
VAVFILNGVFHLWHIVTNWATFSDRAVIDFRYNPYPMLVPGALSVVAGVLLAYRSKWAILAFCAHLAWTMGLLTYYLGFKNLSGDTFLFAAFEMLVIGFCINLWLRSRLR